VSNWKTRRVSFVMGDSYQRIHLIGVKMPVRDTGMNEAGVFEYEGPIEARLKKLEEEMPELVRDRDLVGVLIGETGVTATGVITWVKQSDARDEVGAELIGKQLGRRSALR
jgi:hypothetical protein